MIDKPNSGDTTVKLKPPALATAEDLCAKLGRCCVRIAVAGAVRRREHSPSCIDLVAIPKVEPAGSGLPAHNFLWAVLDYFYADGGYIMRGEVVRSFQVQLQNGATAPPWIPVNVYLATEDTWGSQMVQRTGPGSFWFSLLAKLNGRGYTSCDGRICRITDGSVVPVREETDLFQLAGWLTKEPWQRGAPDRPRGAW